MEWFGIAALLLLLCYSAYPGKVKRLETKVKRLEKKQRGVAVKLEEAPYLDSVCVWDEEKDTLTIFAVNKSLDEDMEVSCDLRQFEGYKIVEHIVLNNDDLQAANTEAQPENVVPVKASAECSKLDGGKLEAVFAKHSWNMIRLAK